jgi:hypothetical protein
MLTVGTAFLGPVVVAATPEWVGIATSSLTSRPAEESWVRPPVFRGIRVAPVAMRDLLALAPREGVSQRFDDAVTITLPIPDGTVQRFQIVESSVMAPELAAQFPEIKSRYRHRRSGGDVAVRFHPVGIPRADSVAARRGLHRPAVAQRRCGTCVLLQA